MLSLFRRKSPHLVSDATSALAETESVKTGPVKAGPAETTATTGRSRGHTPSKRELGMATPKRKTAQARRAEPPPANRREAHRRLREKERAARAEERAAAAAGDERYLPARDKGPERALVRDVVDSRRTLGSMFLVAAVFVVFAGTIRISTVQLASQLLWMLFALAVIVDSVLICRKARRLITERHPKTTQRMRSLYLYAVMRSLSMRRFRIPKPKVAVGTEI